MNLKQIRFGVPAAERDDDLSECFVVNDSYERIRSGSKNIILGNRGSGKSALFRKLKEEESKHGHLVISLAPEDYSYELLSRTMKKEVEGSWAKQGSYTAAWKYLIYVIVMKQLNSSGSKYSYKKGPNARIYEYLRDNHKNIDKNPIGVLISYLKRLEGIKIGEYGAAIKTQELQSLYKLEEISNLLPDLEHICKNTKTFILIDELDKGWDSSEDAIAFVSGLFQAAISINNSSPHIRVLISLRKELYDNIPSLYEDAQKVRDLIETVEWDEPKLLELISRRIANSQPELKDKSYKDVWNSVFVDTLDYRKNKSFNYVIDRSLYRPREIIQFCNDIKNLALLKHVSPPLNYNIIAESENGFSEGRIKDISSEYRFQFPGLLSVFETFRGLTYTMTSDQLEEHCLKISTREYNVGQACDWCENADPEQIIDALWRVGFLKAQAAGGLKARQRSGSKYLGPHQISNLNLRNILRFQVHPMFRSYLSMKESKT